MWVGRIEALTQLLLSPLIYLFSTWCFLPCQGYIQCVSALCHTAMLLTCHLLGFLCCCHVCVWGGGCSCSTNKFLCCLLDILNQGNTHAHNTSSYSLSHSNIHIQTLHKQVCCFPINALEITGHLSLVVPICALQDKHPTVSL